MIRPFFAVFCVLGALALPAEVMAQPSVTMTDLGTLPGGNYSNALAVNEIGDAVGLAVRADGRNRAVLFRNGAVIDLGSLCDTAVCPTNYSNASDINDHGAIVGVSYDATGQLRAFIWENNVMTALPGPAGSTTAAVAINNAGVIVGRVCGSEGCRAARWSSSTSTPQILGALGTGGGTTYSSAIGLNEAGQVVGESTITAPTFRMHAFVWDSVNLMRDLGPGGDACFDRNWATAINTNGVIVGGHYLSCGTNPHMARWVDGVLEDLGSLRGPTGRSYPGQAISDAGDIPGTSDGSACGESEAVLWSQGVMMPLGGPYTVRENCRVSSATGINNRGQIVGQINTGLDPIRPGELHAALWQVQTLPPPTVSCAVPNGAPWYGANVIVACNATSEVGLANPADASFTLATSGEGAALFTPAHAAICDTNSRCTATVGPFGPYKVDKTAPVATVSGVINGLTYALGSVPAAGCSASDALSGVQAHGTLTSNGGPLGVMTFTCSGATDNVGNAAAPVSVLVTVTTPISVNSLGLATSTALASASALAISPDERHVYAVLQLTSPATAAGLAVMNAETYAIESTIGLGGGIPFEIAVSRDGTRAYVAISKTAGATTVAEDSRVAVIDITVNPPTLLKEITLMAGTLKAVALTGVALHPTLPRLYVTDRGQSRVYTIDTTTNTPLSSVLVAGGLLGSSGSVGIKVTPDGTRLYVANRGNPSSNPIVPVTITEVNLISGALTVIPSTLKPSGSLTTLTIAPDGKHAFFATNVATENRVAVLDIDPASGGYRTESFVQTAALKPLRGLATTHDGEYVYATDQGGSNVFVIGTDSMSVVRSIQVGSGPSGVVTRQARGAKAFVSVSGRIAVIAAPGPIASAGPNVSGDEGSAIVLNGSVTDTDSPDALRSWTYTAPPGATGTCAFGDAGAAMTTITCTDNGEYTVTLTADDGDNVSVSDSVVVHVVNGPPTASFSAPGSVNEQQVFTLALGAALDASSVDAAAGFAYAFDCGTGYGPFSTTATIVCTAPAAGAGSQSVNAGGQVRDKDGGVSEYLATIALRDTTPPTLSLTNASATATSGTSVAVTFTATASDLVDGPLTPSCSPASGSMFAIGTTTVHCSATDAHANTASGTLTVTVGDGVAPSVSVPANLTREAASATGVAVTFTATAADNHDPSLSASCSPASGSTFPLGDTSVACRATDAAGNIGTANFTVTIVDTTAPALHLPANQSLIAASPAGAPVTFTATANDLVSGAVAVTCSLGNGAIAAIGTTAVNCSATDGAGNTAHGTFSVSVGYNTCLLYDTNKVHKSGSTAPIKLQLCSATGQNLSSPSIVVQARSLALISTNADGAVEDAGQSNPDGNFRYDASIGGYIFNLKTTGLPAGSFELRFTAGNAPGLSGARFKVR